MQTAELSRHRLWNAADEAVRKYLEEIGPTEIAFQEYHDRLPRNLDDVAARGMVQAVMDSFELKIAVERAVADSIKPLLKAYKRSDWSESNRVTFRSARLEVDFKVDVDDPAQERWEENNKFFDKVVSEPEPEEVEIENHGILVVDEDDEVLLADD